jgi:hypothetical protein
MKEGEGEAEGLAEGAGVGFRDALAALRELMELIETTRGPREALRRLASRMAEGERRALLLGVLLAEAAGLNLRGKRRATPEGTRKEPQTFRAGKRK